MTPTERAKRSDALYYETVSVNRRVLCDMVANREADLEDARAENEELWALNEHMGLKYMAAMGELGEENDQLNAENAKLRESVKRLMTQRDERLARAETDNAKLRELVRDMWHEGMCECDERGACAECEYGYLDRMRELGVDE